MCLQYFEQINSYSILIFMIDIMLKDTKIHAFFKRKSAESSNSAQEQELISNPKSSEPFEKLDPPYY